MAKTDSEGEREGTGIKEEPKEKYEMRIERLTTKK